jgi:hypothetical protein
LLTLFRIHKKHLKYQPLELLKQNADNSRLRSAYSFANAKIQAADAVFFNGRITHQQSEVLVTRKRATKVFQFAGPTHTSNQRRRGGAPASIPMWHLKGIALYH